MITTCSDQCSVHVPVVKSFFYSVIESRVLYASDKKGTGKGIIFHLLQQSMYVNSCDKYKHTTTVEIHLLFLRFLSPIYMFPFVVPFLVHVMYIYLYLFVWYEQFEHLSKLFVFCSFASFCVVFVLLCFFFFGTWIALFLMEIRFTVWWGWCQTYTETVLKAY